MNRKYLLGILLLIFFFGSACERTNPRKSCLPGEYKGTTFSHSEGANPQSGFYESDSAYEDGYQVSLVSRKDSLILVKDNARFAFLYDPKDEYTLIYGTHSHITFRFTKDSLYSEYYSYGGYSGYYNLLNVHFKGKRTE